MIRQKNDRKYYAPPGSQKPGGAFLLTTDHCPLDSILALSVTCGDSSPKGRALGKTKSFFSSPEPLPLGEVDLRSKDGEGEDAALNHAAGGLL